MPKTDILYKKIANKNNLMSKTSISNIRWNIDKSLKVMNRLTSSEKIFSFFPYDTSPSTKEFLNSMIRNLNE